MAVLYRGGCRIRKGGANLLGLHAKGGVQVHVRKPTSRAKGGGGGPDPRPLFLVCKNGQS